MTDAPDWIDPETWLPRDIDTADPCVCACPKYAHRKGHGCLYGGAHPNRDCRRYAPARLDLGLSA